MRDLSPRVQLLLERFQERYAELGTRLYVETDDAAALGRVILQAYHDTVGQPTVLRRAHVLEVFAQRFPVEAAQYELLLGRQTFNPPWSYRDHPAAAIAELGYAGSTGHIVHDYAALVRKGVGGLQREVSTARRRADTPEAAVTAVAFERALAAFSHYIERHARAAEVLAEQMSAARAADWWQRAGNLIVITDHAPQTFAQAVQLVWFAQVFLHVENPSMAISFGRLDQCLWPLLQADLQTGRTTEARAFDLVCAFCLKCCEGEESQNLTVGGVDAEGREAVNPLAVMFLEALAALRCHQPSLTVRHSPGGDEELLEAACRLAAGGSGQPGFMNDEVVPAALEAAGIPADRARDWAIVGCYEAVPQGDCYPNTVLGGLHLPAALADYLQTATAPGATSPPDFEAFLNGFYAHLGGVYDAELQRLQQTWNHLSERAPSPFGSTLLGGCVERLTPLEAGGANFNLVGIDILGLGTLVDSLQAVRKAVYEEAFVTLGELATAVGEDFPDEALRVRLKGLPGRYGTDDAASNELAARVSEWIARRVLDSRLEHEVRPYPAFFRFSADIYDLRTASPDGRRSTDFVSYGAGPSTGVATEPTAVLRSVSHVAHRLCACGNPLSLSLPQPPLPPEEGAKLVRDLVDTYFSLGGMHLHFNTPSAEELRGAQRDPAAYQDLMIRVSGFSARFVRLDARWQDALIERAEGGG